MTVSESKAPVNFYHTLTRSGNFYFLKQKKQIMKEKKRNEGQPAAWSAGSKKSFKMAVRFYKELDIMRTADQFYMRMENKPPKNKGKYYKVDRNVSKRTRRAFTLVSELFPSTWWIELWRMCRIKRLYFKALGNKFMKAVQFLIAAKNKVFSTSNSSRPWTMQKVNHMWPNLRFRKPLFAVA